MARTYLKHILGVILALCTLGLIAAPAEAINLRDWGDQEPNATKRFKVLNKFNGEAVLDKETQLVWEQEPSNIDVTWSVARFECADKTVGGRKGWRLPAFYELASLVDPNNPNGDPDLPPGHPFSNVQNATYWSATTLATDIDAVEGDVGWLVDFDSGFVATSGKSDMRFVWCVRGGSPGPTQY